MSEPDASQPIPNEQPPPRGCSPSEWRIFTDYYDRLAKRAERLLSKRRQRVSNGEDIAAVVLYNFFRRRREGLIPRGEADDDLWPQLALMARRQVYGQIRKELRQKRGRGDVRGESVFAKADWSGPAGFDQLAFHAPSAEEAAIAIEAVNAMLAVLSEEESRVAAARLEGHSVAEIAERLGCSISSVERRLRLIRSKLAAHQAVK